MKRFQLFLVVIFITAFFTILTAGNMPQEGWVSLENDSEGSNPSVNIIEAKDDILILEISIPGFYADTKDESGIEYTRLSMPDSVSMTDIGKAELPHFGKLLQFPFDSDLRYRIIDKETVSYENVLLYPTQKMPNRSNPGFRYPFFADSEFYRSSETYPGSIITLGDTGTLRDIYVGRLGIYPFQYNPAERRLDVHKRITVAVDIKSGSESRMFKDGSVSRTFDALYEGTVLNYNTNSRGVRVEAESMLLFVEDALESSIQPFIDWKNSKGIKVYKLLMSSVGSTTTAIQNAIDNAYATYTPTPTYVLFVGHVSGIPPNYRSTSDGNAASDYPYTLMDGDNYPDLLIGRILANNTTQVDVQVSKIVNYEQNPFTGTAAEFYSKAFGIASNEGSSPSDEDYINGIANYLLNGTYTYHDYFFQGDYNATAANISAAINNGRTYATYIGHGSGTSWGSTNDTFSNTQVHALSNGFKLLALIDVACLNGQFDDISECFGEAWMWAGTASVPKGAVAYYGGSVSISWHPPAIMATGIAKHHFEDPVYSFGGSCLAGQMYLVAQEGWGSDVEDNFEWYNIFGDPSLMLRTASPETISVTHPTMIASGSTSAEVNVSVSKAPFEQALVCIYASNNDDIYASAFTDASGDATLTFDTGITPTDELHITVTGYNTTVYESTILAGSTSDGIISFDSDAYSCSATADITLLDGDLEGQGTHIVEVSSTTYPSGIDVVLTETATAGMFEGSVVLGSDIAVSNGDTLTVTYYDANTGKRASEYKTDTASIDCSGPVISGINVVALGGNYAEIGFTTSEPATSVLLWGSSCSSMPYSADASTSYNTSHEGTIDGLTTSTKYYYKVQATDEYGNTTTSACLNFTTVSELIIGNGTVEVSPAPIYTYYHDNRTQVIYTADDLGNAPLTISSLAINVSSLPSLPMTNWTIRMKHTTKDDYESSAVFENTGWTVVYQADTTISTTGWNEFVFSANFEYDGTQNLMVDFSFNNTAWESPGGKVYWTGTSTAQAIYGYTDSGYGDPLDWSSSTHPTVYTSDNYVNLKLGLVAEENPETEPALVSFNADSPAVYSWEYSFSKPIEFGMKGSTWVPVMNGAYAEKLVAGDITGDGNNEVVGYFPGFGLYYYNLTEWVSIIDSTILDFDLVEMPGSTQKQIYASFAGQGVYKWNYAKGIEYENNVLNSKDWTAIIATPAYLILAIDVDKNDTEDVVMSFDSIAGTYVYNCTTSEFNKILTISLTDATAGDFTGDGYKELIVTFEGYGIYVMSYSKGLDSTPLKLATNKEGLDDISRIDTDNVWYKGRDYSWMRLLVVASDTDSKLATGDIAGDSMDELVAVIQGRTYYYNPSAATWTKLADIAFERVGAGYFTGGANEDLIVSCSQLDRIFLFISETQSFEKILEGMYSSGITGY